MSHRLLKGPNTRTPRRPSKLQAGRGHRSRCLPAVEGLEGRTLLSYGGSPDLSFGTLGNQLYTYVPTSSQFSQVGQAIQADGKFLIAGDLLFPSTPPGEDTYSNAVARYNADGTIDTTFGTGGYFISGALSEQFTSVIPYEDGVQAIALQPDGKILLATDIEGVAKVARIDTKGTLDATFGTGGVVDLGSVVPANTLPSILDYAESVAVLPDGNIAVGGSVVVGSASAPAVELLNANGVIDTTYGTAGLATIAAPTGFSWAIAPGFEQSNTVSLLAQPDGKVIFVGVVVVPPSGTYTFNTSATVLNRLDANGTPDATFGTAGQVLVPAPFVNNSTPFIYATKLAIQPDGKLVLGGSALANMFVAVRLDVDGTPDSSFGIGGYDILPSSYNVTEPTGLAIQADGKLLFSGSYDRSVIRLQANGLPDPSFGEGGQAIIPLAAGVNANAVSGVSVLSDGKIMAFSDSEMTRLLASGASGDYTNDGISDPAVLVTTTATVIDRPSGGGQDQVTQIGDPGAPFTLPSPGAYDGGGVSELAVYRPGSGVFDVKPYAGGPDVLTAFGTPGLGNTLPAPGDYDHSGKTELAIYSPAQGAFFYRPANGGKDVAVPFGLAGAGQSIPAPADYFDTGQTDFAVYLVQQGELEIRNPLTGQDYFTPFGTPGAGQAIPAPGDYDGSGFDELAVYVPASGDLIYRPHAGGTDVIVPFGTPGIAKTIPAPGDYDGSGHTEVAGYDPDTATFSYLPAAGGAAVTTLLGSIGVTVPYSMGTNSVAESGIGGSPPGSFVRAESVEIPLTPDVLETLAGTAAKKTARSS